VINQKQPFGVGGQWPGMNITNTRLLQNGPGSRLDHKILAIKASATILNQKSIVKNNDT
jgi:hypothetical protein